MKITQVRPLGERRQRSHTQQRRQPGRETGVVLRWPLVVGFGLLAVVLAAQAAPADQRDARLDGLFERLKATQNSGEAERLQQRIWEIWTLFDDAVVSRLMTEGMLAMASQEYGRALERFDRTVAMAPGFAEAWNKRATVHYLLGDFDASVVDIQRTLELEPRHFGALSGLGLIYDALGEPAAALRSFEAALEINPHLTGTRERIEELRRHLQGRGI